MGAVGSGDNDVKMLKKSKVAFSKLLMIDHEATKAADIILKTDTAAAHAECILADRADADPAVSLTSCISRGALGLA